MNREDALKKIKKCMALGRSAEPHEAAAAMRQAQKLMAEFQVADHELSLADIKEVSAKASQAAIAIWENGLATLVAEAFGCEHFASKTGSYDGAGNWRSRLSYVFVGLDAAPQVAAYAFEVLTRQCAKARLAHIAKQPRNCKPITKSARGDEFAKGWVFAVEPLVGRFARSDRDEALLLGYMSDRHPDLKKVKPRDASKGRKVTHGHRMAGYAAGKNAELNNGIAGMEERRLLA